MDKNWSLIIISICTDVYRQQLKWRGFWEKITPIHSTKLTDLIDLTAVQKMADSHYKATGIPIGLIDVFDNSVLVGAGWQDICILFHRANPDTLKRCVESDNFIKANLDEHTPSQYKCLNGLWDIGMPVIVGGQHLATLFLGQFFYEDEVPDRQVFIDQARKYSFDQQKYLDALDQAPLFTRDKVQIILEYDAALIGFFADLAGKKLLQKQGEEERDALEIAVQDTGSGISPEHLNKIFDPFFTTKAHLGTGLGLATVYGTVQQHHGAIHVVSELGAGTTFQILLPLATDEQFMSTTLPTIQEGRGRVLVVDDEDMIRSTAEALLEDLGYEVLLAEDG